MVAKKDAADLLLEEAQEIRVSTAARRQRLREEILDIERDEARASELEALAQRTRAVRAGVDVEHPKTRPRSIRSERILAAVQGAGGPITRDEIAALTGYDREEVRVTLRYMIEINEVRQVAMNTYQAGDATTPKP